MIEFWNNLLYYPLINILVWLYNGPAAQNIVWAVVLLTIGLRVLLLPLSIAAERDKAKFIQFKPQLDDINKQFKNDPVQKKIEIRNLLKRYHFSPWAKTIVLAVQVLVFILLYNVFIGGVRGKISSDILYSWVDFPTYINTDFFGFNAAERSFVWAAVVGVILFWQINKEQRERGGKISKKELYFSLFFPLFVFLFLWMIPMVKSIFILTSILFSVTIAAFGKMSAIDE